MAGHSFSSLRDLLKNQSPHESPNLLPKALLPSHQDHPLVTEMFGELYFRESSSPPLPSSSPLPSLCVQTNARAMVGQNHEVLEKGCVYNKATRLYPPPISCLKLSKCDKPFVDFMFDQNPGRFVRKEIRIPDRGVFRAAREDGRLILNFVPEEEGAEIMEEVKEEMLTNDMEEPSDEDDSEVDGFCV
ncbi:hypothetical protein NMG60_11022104 [Bertholletia excelsa]